MQSRRGTAQFLLQYSATGKRLYPHVRPNFPRRATSGCCFGRDKQKAESAEGSSCKPEHETRGAMMQSSAKKVVPVFSTVQQQEPPHSDGSGGSCRRCPWILKWASW